MFRIIFCCIILYACLSALVFMPTYNGFFNGVSNGVVNPFKHTYLKYHKTLNTAGIIILENFVFIIFFPGWVLLWTFAAIFMLIGAEVDLFFKIFKKKDE